MELRERPAAAIARPAPDIRSSTGAVTALMLVGAGLVLWSGAIHLELWSSGYRSIPTIGPLFLAQAGSLPTGKGGTLPTSNPAGCLIVLSDAGTVVETISNDDIVGPWDMTAISSAGSAQLFVANALGGNKSTDHGVPVAGTCTVVRVTLRLAPTTAPALVSTTVIGSDFPWHADKAALVLAPTGVALGADGTLFVDDTQTDAVSAIPDATTRTTAVTASTSNIFSGGSLNAPSGMLLAPNGDLVIVNGNDGKATELSPAGEQVATKTLVKQGAGDVFGLTTSSTGTGIEFVNDGTSAVDLLLP